MAPRATWTGQLRLSLVTIPVKLYPAAASERRIELHQIHEPTGKRIRYQKVAPGVGPVESDDIIKGFEYERGKFILLDQEEIDALKLESKHTLELTRFVDESEIDPRYFERPYYLLPDGEMAEEGYAVLQRALAAAKKVGIGQLFMRGQSHIVAVRASGHGLMLEMLRHAYEIRSADEFFGEIPEVEVEKEALDLAMELIERKSGAFEPKQFTDDYHEAVWELINAKLENRTPDIVTAGPSGAKVISIMDALKKSVKQQGKKRAERARSTVKKSAKSGQKRKSA
jgi:DNA end-binding protein Ku